jgi:signal transduction histidine kinase
MVSIAVPMLAPLPAPLLRPGVNTFEITLAKWGALAGSLGGVMVAPDATVRPDYERRVFFLSTLPRMIDGWQIAIGAVVIIMWIARPQERALIVFAAILLSHSIASLPALMGDRLDEWAVRLINHARFLGGSLILPLAWLIAGQRPPVPIGAFLLLPAVIFVSFLSLPDSWHRLLITVVVMPLIILFALTAVIVLGRAAFRRHDSGALMVCNPFLLILTSSLHDALVFRGVLRGDDLLVSRFTTPLITAIVSMVLIWRFAQTMTLLDRFSTRLRNEVTAVEDALRLSFEREQAQARAADLEAERVRLMSDLHDGIAGQLVSILATCELEGRGSDGVADALRGALTDLRLVVASLENSGDDLGVTLALFRERLEPQLAAHGMALVWRVASLPEVTGLNPGVTLNIFRILQEASINAARHSGSEVLILEACPSASPEGGVRLSLSDHGRGGVAPRPGSYGLGNMRRRAEAMGAGLSITSGPQGTTVALDLPARLS